jgi:two-component system chemotaxis response regulator CheY
MPLQNLDTLFLVLIAWTAGLATGWGLCAWALRRRQPTATEPQCEVPACNVSRGPKPPVVEAPRLTLHTAPARAPMPGHTLVRVPAELPRTALPQAADLLLVDDSDVARTKLRRLFEGAGYQVHLANDGVEALKLLDKGAYKLLITDLEMPNMDGITLIDTCLSRPHTARMPIVAISGHESLRAKFNQCRDISGIHRKPWVDEILLSHVAMQIDASTSRASFGRIPQTRRVPSVTTRAF